MIAADMRLKVYQLMQQGKTTQQIIALYGGALRQFRDIRTAGDAIDPDSVAGTGAVCAHGGAVIFMRARRGLVSSKPPHKDA